MSHTPGPWKWKDGYCGTRNELVGANGEIVIDRADYEGMWITGATSQEEAANASLIAAAPEMLEALYHVRVCASCAEGSWEDCEGGRAALAAIAKAEGK